MAQTYVEGLAADFHRFVAANDKAGAQTVFSEIKKIFGFVDEEAQSFVAQFAPKAPAAPTTEDPAPEVPKQ